MIQVETRSARSSHLSLVIDGVEVDVRGPSDVLGVLDSVYRRHRRAVRRGGSDSVRGLRLRVAAEHDIAAANVPAASARIVNGVAECNGRRVLRAAAVERDGRAMLIVGEEGSGRSTLAINLLAGGWKLLGDEYLFVTGDGEHAIAHQALLSLSALSTPHMPSAFRKALEHSRWYATSGGSDLRFYEVDPTVVFGPNVWANGARIDAIVVLGEAGGENKVKTIEPERTFEMLGAELARTVKLKPEVRVGAILPRHGAHCAELIDSWYDVHSTLS
jgi:hypothetical protein